MKDVFVHKTALVESTYIGAGTKIWAFAHVMDNVRVGRQCNIGDHVFLEGGCVLGDGVTLKNNVMVWDGVTIGDYVFVGPGVVFTNDRYPRSPRNPRLAAQYENTEYWRLPTAVHEGASVGANAVILPGLTLGEYCVVAAGSVVTEDALPFAMVMGNPARQVAHVGYSGRKLKREGSFWIDPVTKDLFRLKGERVEPLQ